MIARHFILWLLCLAAAIVSLVWQLVAIVGSPRRAMRIAVGFDQTANAAFGGDEDETISSRAWRLRRTALCRAGAAHQCPVQQFKPLRGRLRIRAGKAAGMTHPIIP
ncbi:MAG: hypothetical protein KBD39_01570 [Sterolibacterium sp.]|nr:hypothetical protein [Sterolibacterium sp.]